MIIRYEAINPNGTVEWVELIPVAKFGKDSDSALANFLSDITWMDNWETIDCSACYTNGNCIDHP